MDAIFFLCSNFNLEISGLNFFFKHTIQPYKAALARIKLNIAILFKGQMNILTEFPAILENSGLVSIFKRRTSYFVFFFVVNEFFNHKFWFPVYGNSAALFTTR